MGNKSSFIASSVGILATSIVVPIVISYLYKILKKKGVKELTEDDIKKLKDVKIPRWFNYLNNFLLIALMAAWLGSMAVLVYWFPAVQRHLCANHNAILFKSSDGIWLFILGVPMLSLIFLGCGLLISLIFPEYDIYERAANIKKGRGGIYNLELPTSLYVKMIVPVLLIILVLLFFSFKEFLVIDDNKLILGRAFSITNKTYSWEDIKEVRMRGFPTEIVWGVKYQDNTPDIFIVLSDGKIVDIWNSILPESSPTEQEFINFIKKVKEKRIPFKLEKLNAHDIGILRGKRKDYRDKILNVFNCAEKELG